jgi:hypothetical protein
MVGGSDVLSMCFNSDMGVTDGAVFMFAIQDV